METDANKAIVRRFVDDLWNRRRLDLADELFSPACVTHQLRSGAEDAAAPRGPDAVREHVREWVESFPDLRFDVERMVAEDDLVTTWCVMRGTHAKPWLGVAPTGARVGVRLVVTHRIAGGKIVEDWVIVEALGLLQQLGLVASNEELFAPGE